MATAATRDVDNGSQFCANQPSTSEATRSVRLCVGEIPPTASKNKERHRPARQRGTRRSTGASNECQ
eukprot:3001355-Alexandrium_andersonii.AAC.1